jgi:carotenoid 1,2-hydratase
MERLFHASDSAHEDSGPLSRGRVSPSGTGRSDGSDVRTPRSREHPGGPDFSQAVPKGGYIWWYVDGISDDESNAITLIAFVGSVFSPYYAVARGLGKDDPENHCALNVALYGRSSKHWTLTERTRTDLDRSASAIRIGPSRLEWDGEALTIFIEEITVPLPARVVGTVRVYPQSLVQRAFALDADSHHHWHPVAPQARIEVKMQQPDLEWSGNAYIDSNFGDEPLEAGFVEWDWMRAKIGTNTAVLYDVIPRRSQPASLGLLFDPQGGVEEMPAPARRPLPSTLWRVARHARSENGPPTLIKTLEDTPFYNRSLVSAAIGGTEKTWVHESLSLDRFANPVVRAMLPFRMPRRRWRRT